MSENIKMLSINRLNSYYGDVRVIRNLDLNCQSGEVLCLAGRNGAGKSTLLKSIMSMISFNGTIALDGYSIENLPPHQIPKLGVGYVPQGRRLFCELTVKENLTIALMSNTSLSKIPPVLFELFPALESRLNQVSGTLSGGEQQMLAMARAYCLSPKLLLLDEPTEGLMPSMISTIRNVITQLKSEGVAILLVEQRVESVLPIVDNIVFLENGEIKAHVTSVELADNLELMQKYVGLSKTEKY